MKIRLLSAALIVATLAVLGHNLSCVAEEEGKKKEGKEESPVPEGVFRTSYALSGDLQGVKREEEAIYITKGDVTKALAALKEIIIEHRRPAWSFSRKDPLNIIVFRGALKTHGKIEITAMAPQGKNFEVRAKYTDFPGLDIPSQPAAIVPLGKLPRGNYSVTLYVDDQPRKNAQFKVR